MSPSFTPRQLQSFRTELEERLEMLQDEQDESLNEGALLVQRLELEIGACEAALGRLDRGCFGVCEQCGEFIETNRLVASPSESLCLSCRLKSPV